MIKKISPSVMCADFLDLKATLHEFEERRIELLHVDIMDGVFVPNFTLGTDFVKMLKKSTTIPLDIHCMVTDVEKKLEWFPFGEGDYVSVHYESTQHLGEALTYIRSKGAKPMIALSPDTPISVLNEYLDNIDAVLIMTVYPGFAGQKLIESTLDKIRQLRVFLDKNGYEDIEIEVDGNVSFTNAVRMNKVGANIFVAGTSSVFRSDMSLSEGIAQLRQVIGEQI